MKQPLIVLTGPTAVGKTKASIGLAKTVGGEIISADSMQVYRGMDIGSAKITPEEMDGVKHYLVDVLEPEEDFNVVRFQSLARQAMQEIYVRGRIPIIVGGTGFYIQSVLYDIDFTETDKDMTFRKSLENIAREKGVEYVHHMLCQADPDAAAQLHPNNLKRVIRALEFYRQTGIRISEHNRKEREKESPYHYIYFVLTDDRARLYERIDRRVDQMMESGLLDEVQALKKRGIKRTAAAMQGLGYKELYSYLDGECSLQEAVRIIKQDTRHFAKRQITWFKREKDVIWIRKGDFSSESELLDEMLGYLTKSGIWKPERKND